MINLDSCNSIQLKVIDIDNYHLSRFNSFKVDCIADRMNCPNNRYRPDACLTNEQICCIDIFGTKYSLLKLQLNKTIANRTNNKGNIVKRWVGKRSIWKFSLPTLIYTCTINVVNCHFKCRELLMLSMAFNVNDKWCNTREGFRIIKVVWFTDVTLTILR